MYYQKKSAIVALNSREYILLLLVLVVENWEAASAKVLILVWSLPLRCYSLIWLYKYAAISMKRIAGCGSIVWKKNFVLADFLAPNPQLSQSKKVDQIRQIFIVSWQAKAWQQQLH